MQIKGALFLRPRREHKNRAPAQAQGDAQVSDLFNRLFSEEALRRAYKKALKGDGKYEREALLFARDEVSNLKRLQASLENGSYRFSGYYRFVIYEPKKRIINAPFFVDKIVQLALNEGLREIYIPKFIPESFACLPGRGTHAAVEKVQDNLRRCYAKWGAGAYILKLDIKRFYYSIDRELLKSIYRQTIKEADVLRVMDEVTDSAAAIDSVGLPLGNTMSQLYSNIFMDRLDQICKRYWGYRYYVRYADDVIIVLPSKEAAKEAKKRCISFLRDRLHLEVNGDKTQIFPIEQGVNAYGFKIWRTHRLLRNDSKKRIKRKIKKMPKLIKEGRLSIRKADLMLGSWSGYARHAASHNFKQSIVLKRPYIKISPRGGVLRLDKNKL